MSDTVNFRSNFLRLLSWSSFSQVFSFLALPFLSALYAPEDFGVLASFVGISGILTAFISFRFEWYIPNATTFKEAVLYASWALCLALMTAGIIGLYISVFPVHIGNFDGSTSYYILLMAVLQAFIGTLQSTASSLAVKVGELKFVARSNLLTSLSNTLLLIIMGSLGWNYQGLILGFIISHFMAVIYIAIHFDWRLFEIPTFRVFKQHFSETYRRAVVTTFVSTLNTLSHNIIPVMIVSFFSSYTAGIYFMGAKLINAPVSLISSSIGLSFWSEASKRIHQDVWALRKHFIRLTQQLFGLSLLICLAIYVFSPLVPYILDKKWMEVSKILFAFSPIVIGNLCFSGLDHLIVMNKHHYKLYADIVRLTLVVLAIYLSAKWEFSPVYMVLSVTLGSLIGHAVSFYMHLVAYRKVLNT